MAKDSEPDTQSGHRTVSLIVSEPPRSGFEARTQVLIWRQPRASDSSLPGVGPCSCNLWLFRFRAVASRFWFMAFEQLLYTLDGALQLVDQVFVGNGEQIGKHPADLRPDLRIFFAPGLHFKKVFAIYHITDGHAHSHEQGPKPLQQPMRSALEMGHQEIHIHADEPCTPTPKRGCGQDLLLSLHGCFPFFNASSNLARIGLWISCELSRFSVQGEENAP